MTIDNFDLRAVGDAGDLRDHVERQHAEQYPAGCPNLCEACVRRLAGKKFGEQTGEQLEEAAEVLRTIGDIFGLQAFAVTATLPDGASRRCTLYAETWQAAGRQAQQLFTTAINITLDGRTIHN